MQHITICLVFLGNGALAQTAARKVKSATDKAVAEKALRIVSGIHGSWTQMPGNIATARMTGGALIGNGSVGVAIGGTADQQQYYVGRDDFWSVQRGKIMPVGRLQLTIPALQNATAQLQENVGPADVTASFAGGDRKAEVAFVGRLHPELLLHRDGESRRVSARGERSNAERLRAG